MKNRKLWVSVLAGLMALIMILSLVLSVLPTHADAASSGAIKEQLDELEEQKEKIEEEIQKLRDQLADNLDEMEKIVAQKDLIDQEISLLHQQIATTNEQISAYGVLIADKQEELTEAENKLAALQEKNKERIRAMEEDGTLSYWSVLFEANSFSDLLDRLNMIEEIAAADQRRLQEMNTAAKAVSDAKAELETEKAGLEEIKEELKATQIELEGKRATADRLLVDLIAAGEKFEELMDQSEDEQSKLMEEIAKKEEEYEDAKYQEWLATSVPDPTFAGGAGTGQTIGNATWLVPISYTRMTSPFGMRWHPVYGGYKMHYGVDLAAPSGTPIGATRAGVVTKAYYSSSGGYTVEIDHQDGFVSQYLHQTHYIVSVGDYVSAGQIIGYVGSTGTSTGPHLHFSIKYNGEHVNPANYISI